MLGMEGDSSSDSDAVKPQTFSAPQTTDDRDAAALSVSVAAGPLLHFANGASYSRDDSSTSLAQEGSLLTPPAIGDFLSSMRKAVTQNITLRYELL